MTIIKVSATAGPSDGDVGVVRRLGVSENTSTTAARRAAGSSELWSYEIAGGSAR